MKKKLLVGLISTALVIGVTVPASATTTQATKSQVTESGMTILVDNAKVKQVKTVEGSKVSIASYDKQTNILEIVENGKVLRHIDLTTSIQSLTPKLQSWYSNKMSAQQQSILPGAQIISQGGEGWWGYSYVDYTTDRYATLRWDISDGESTKRTILETSSNSGSLFSFAKAVDTMDTGEIAVYAACGAALTATLVGFLTAPSGVGITIAALVALGATFTAASTAYNVYVTSKEADRYFAAL